MKLWDILILAAVAAGVFFAVRFLRKGGGGCCGDCEKCRGCHKKGGGGC